MPGPGGGEPVGCATAPGSYALRGSGTASALSVTGKDSMNCVTSAVGAGRRGVSVTAGIGGHDG